jgi:hypothetical protein
MQIQGLTIDFPTETPAQLRAIAAAVRRLGNAHRRDPEQLIADREMIEQRLYGIASDLERRGR